MGACPWGLGVFRHLINKKVKGTFWEEVKLWYKQKSSRKGRKLRGVKIGHFWGEEQVSVRMSPEERDRQLRTPHALRGKRTGSTTLLYVPNVPSQTLEGWYDNDSKPKFLCDWFWQYRAFAKSQYIIRRWWQTSWNPSDKNWKVKPKTSEALLIIWDLFCSTFFRCGSKCWEWFSGKSRYWLELM